MAAIWLQHLGPGSTANALRRAVAAIEGDDDPHTVVFAADPGPVGMVGAVTHQPQPVEDGAALADLLRHWAVAGAVAAAALPAPGDPTGVPSPVSALALEEGECLLVHDASGASWAAVPVVEVFGSEWEPGRLVEWRVTPVPDWRTTFLATVGSLPDAERSMRATLSEAIGALDQLDVARWRPDAASALGALRSAPTLTVDLPDDLAARRIQVLVTAARLRRVVELATEDDGGAVSLWQADQRSTALRTIDRAARVAIAAASLGLDPAARLPQR